MHIPSSNAVKIVKISKGYWTSFTDADLTAALALASRSACLCWNVSPWPNIICKFWWSFRMKQCCTNYTTVFVWWRHCTATSSKLHVPSRNFILDQVSPKFFRAYIFPPVRPFHIFVLVLTCGHHPAATFWEIFPGLGTPKDSHGTWKWTLGKGDTFWKPTIFRFQPLVFRGCTPKNKQLCLDCNFFLHLYRV